MLANYIKTHKKKYKNELLFTFVKVNNISRYKLKTNFKIIFILYLVKDQSNHPEIH